MKQLKSLLLVIAVAFTTTQASAQIRQDGGIVNPVRNGGGVIIGQRQNQIDPYYAEQLITLLYRASLFREPDFPGMQTFQRMVANQGFQGLVNVALGLGRSPEARNISHIYSPEQIVWNYYGVLFNRAPDPGAQGWINLFRQGRGSDVLASFVQSQEFRQIYFGQPW